MGNKRKRQAEDSAVDEPAPKKLASKTTATSAAERRQQRSERKSKKAKGKLKDKSKKKSKKQTPKPQSQVPPASPEFVRAIPASNGSHVEGQDFIPLTDSNDTHTKLDSSNPTNAPQNPEPKRKRVSPRSERKKARAEKALAAEQAQSTAAAAPAAPATTSAGTDQSGARFIVFVGNLPFTATTPQITKHFHKLNPISIRHATDKDTGKSKGYAFLEFDNYSAMKTCLKVYHHSMFDPERTSKLPDEAFDENGLEIAQPGEQEKKGTGRRLNVELTAGGGGKGKGRREKIKAKNTRLKEQRDRRREAEMKAEKAKIKQSGANESKQVEGMEKKDESGERGNIHPSRLNRVRG